MSGVINKNPSDKPKFNVKTKVEKKIVERLNNLS